MMLLLNLIVMVAGLYWAKQAFEDGQEFWGWVNLFASSLNLAVVLDTLF